MKKFAFITNPRGVDDVARILPLIKIFPNKLTELIIERWDFLICSHFNIFRVNKEIEGYIIGIGFTGKRMIELPKERVREKILKTVLFTQNKLKAEIIGLGSLTKSVTEGGKWVVGRPEVKTTITHGDTYTVAVAEEGIERILNIYKFNKNKIKIAIVGAYGLIGREISLYLARKNYSLILIEKNEEKVNLIKEELKKKSLVEKIFIASTNLKDIYQADLVITVTSHPLSLLKNEHLKNGAIIYDIAQPMNVSPSLLKERPDLIKIDGAYVDINGIDLKFDMGLPKGITFACLVETIMMALEGENNHHVGKIDEVYLKKIKILAKKYGFSHAPFTSFNKPISLKEIYNKKL